jgi:pyrophosphate--fructose-6-phosphate 1-phosphotransferase
MIMDYSPLQKARYHYTPVLPEILQKDITTITPSYGEKTESAGNQTELKEQFPHSYGRKVVTFTEGPSQPHTNAVSIGVVLSGGQAPGGHNVIAGIFDAMTAANPDSKLYGFLGGPAGILEDRAIELTANFIDSYRNTGGFDMIGSGRTKIETEEQFAASAEVCRKRGINALVIIGGDDSNTNAALLAEYFIEHDIDIKVIGVPKTIDGDLRNELVEASFGFDTATKTYSELIGNIERDANSAKKYWHFIKLMGRSASHIALECALKCQPNVAIISEEVESNHTALNEIVEHLAQTVVTRSEQGENFGLVLVPEGLIEFIPEMKGLISELNTILAEHGEYFATLKTFEDQSEYINKHLSRDASYVFSSLPNNIQRQLLMDRDPHGNVQVSRIETEKLLIEMVEDRLNELKAEGQFKGKFSPQHHFFGYEGRAGFPSNFDANYGYSLGYNAYLLIAFGLTGYISSIRNLAAPAEEWIAGGVPITMMMNMEMRKGKMKPVIRKSMVDLYGRPFKAFAARREEWAVKTSYTYPGPIQFFGPDEVCNQPSISLTMEQGRD